MSDQGPAPTTFEEALDALEGVVQRLETGEIGLEEAVRLFEAGQGYLAICRERLSVAQGRIEELTAADLPAAPRIEEPFGPAGADAEAPELQ